MINTLPVHSKTDNVILRNLPRSEYDRISNQLKSVDLKLNVVLHRPGEPAEFVYFPSGSMVSLIANTPAGESVEVGIVGFEGAVGLWSMFGDEKSPFEALVQFPQIAQRIPVRAFRDEFKRAGAL